MRRPAPLALIVLLAAAGAAHAGETRCWLDNGVVVVPAELAGVAGDYILDPATPQTQMGETQAQGAGFADAAFSGALRLAGQVVAAQPVIAADLDLRTGALPTPVAGVIGADALRAFVVDVQFAPCRVALWRPGEAPPFRRGRPFALDTASAVPTVTAGVSDGERTLSGPFALAVGGDTAVRLADDLAAAPGASKPKELYPGGAAFPRLRALSFAGALFESLPAGLMPAAPDGPAGEIGAPILSRYRLRLDMPGDRLWLAPAR